MNISTFEDIDLESSRDYIENYERLTIEKEKRIWVSNFVELDPSDRITGELMSDYLSSEYIQWVENLPHQKCTGKTVTYGINTGTLCEKLNHTHNDYSDPMGFKLLNEIYIRQEEKIFKYRDNKKTTRIELAKLAKQIEDGKRYQLTMKIVEREFKALKYLAVEMELKELKRS